MTRTEKARVAELFQLLGLAPEPVATAKPRTQAKRKTNTFKRDVIDARIPCAYGAASCKSHRFAPNGVGSKQHTTCKKGLAAMKAARA